MRVVVYRRVGGEALGYPQKVQMSLKDLALQLGGAMAEPDEWRRTKVEKPHVTGHTELPAVTRDAKVVSN